MERITRACTAVAVALLLLGVGLRLAPAPAAAARLSGTATAGPAAAPRAAQGKPPGIADSIVAGNLFAAARTPPRVRYAPPDLVPTPGRPTLGRARSAPAFRLFGTVVGPTGTAALIDADPAIRGAEIYGVGDLVAGQRIVAVSESTVVLEGRSGRSVLRLPPNSLRTP
ncbi:MAG: hypothetical protein ABIQ49_01105 [Gemmatimonadales bacterium]